MEDKNSNPEGSEIEKAIHSPEVHHHALRIVSSAALGALLMGGFVYGDNAEHGKEVALESGKSQAAYTFASSSLLNAIYDFMTKKLEGFIPRPEDVLNLSFSVLTATINYQVHKALGTPDAMNAAITTFLACGAGFAAYEYGHRALSNVSLVRSSPLLSRVFHKSNKES